MKALKISAILVLAAFCYLVANAAGKPADIGKVSFMVCQAQVKKENTPDWKPLQLKLQIAGGDYIKTQPEEMVEITLNNGGVVRVGEKSEVMVLAPDSSKVRTEIKGSGKIWSNFKKLGGKGSFEISTGTAVASIRGTIFRVNKNAQDSSSSVAVYDGKVDVGPEKALKAKLDAANPPGQRSEVSGPTEVPGPFEVSLNDWVSIVRGMQIDIRPDGKYNKFQFNQQQDSQDPWVKMNEDRDKAAGINGK
jgi:hypothetical protein